MRALIEALDGVLAAEDFPVSIEIMGRTFYRKEVKAYDKETYVAYASARSDALTPDQVKFNVLGKSVRARYFNGADRKEYAVWEGNPSTMMAIGRALDAHLKRFPATRRKIQGKAK